MNSIILYVLPLVLLFATGSSESDSAYSSDPVPAIELIASSESLYNSLKLHKCYSYFNNDVDTYDVFALGSKVGNAIWINRSSKRARAKYFAHKQAGYVVHDRYNNWRQDKSVFLISSGAYANGWDGTNLPVGLTIDNGEIVNQQVKYTMDGLIIVERVGGIRVTNIEDGDLYLQSINEHVNITNSYDRQKFINWAEQEEATVFQTHLLIYRNKVEVGTNASSRSDMRRMLVLAEAPDGTVHHGIVYLRRNYTLYNAAHAIKDMVNNQLKMEIVAAVNLDTGGFDVLSTGENVKDCSNRYITGSNNEDRESLTNMLAYYYE